MFDSANGDVATHRKANAARTQDGDWQAAHDALVRLARTRAGLDFEEGRWLLAAQRARAHERLGYGSFLEYVERLFGYAPRVTQDKLRVAEALETLPQLTQALRDGQASWSCARELTRVATPATEHAWLERARGRTVREVEKLVAGRRPGSLPNDAAEPSLQRHVLRFEVSGEVLATFREALAKVRRDAGGPLDDDSALLLLARHVLAGPVDEGRASYQMELTVCERCQRATQTAQGESLEVATEVAAMARCDGQRLASASSKDPHVGVDRHEDAAGRKRRRSLRAKQDVPPGVRRQVLRRDRHRCQIPGCTHANFVDVHHIRTREDGGGHDAENLLTLCGAHHRACHRGELIVQGNVASGLVFQHADGTSYGKVVSAAVADVQTQAFRALRGLGFGERDARRALSQVAAESDVGVQLEPVLRRALAVLTRSLV
jgi:5-methylcytosine-specific restriction endonuclease McrA